MDWLKSIPDLAWLQSLIESELFQKIFDAFLTGGFFFLFQAVVNHILSNRSAKKTRKQSEKRENIIREHEEKRDEIKETCTIIEGLLDIECLFQEKAQLLYLYATFYAFSNGTASDQYLKQLNENFGLVTDYFRQLNNYMLKYKYECDFLYDDFHSCFCKKYADALKCIENLHSKKSKGEVEYSPNDFEALFSLTEAIIPLIVKTSGVLQNLKQDLRQSKIK